MYDHLFDYMYEACKMIVPREQQTSYQAEMAAHYFVSALIGVLRWWVDKDMPCKTEELDRLFKQLAMHGLKDGLRARQNLVTG